MFYMIQLGSVTNAQHARDILKAYGYTPYLSRNSQPKKEEGCGYTVKVNSTDIQMTLNLLRDKGVYIIGAEPV